MTYTGEQTVSKAELLASLPPEWPDDLTTSLRANIQKCSRKLVVLDDDPTGAQAMHSAPVLTRWSDDVLRTALQDVSPLFFVVSNTRSLSQDEAVAVVRDIVTTVARVADDCSVEFDVLVRGDSTLRGHYPYELFAVQDVLRMRDQHFDGVILCPFFVEGGRLTAYDVQWVTDGDQLIPAGRTEYARDRAFGFTHSRLPDWVAEKTQGEIPAQVVKSVGLDVIRKQGPDGVCDVLMDVKDGQPVVVNAVSYRDLQVFVTGLLKAEDAGKRFLFRTAASFLKVRSGIDERGLLRGDDLGIQGGSGGLVIVGSYIQKSTEQLQSALKLKGVAPVELRVDRILDSETRPDEVAQVVMQIDDVLSRKETIVVYTSRTHDLTGDLGVGRSIGDALVACIQKISVRPSFVIVKGGNTAITVVRDGLGAYENWALGQIMPGVPVWRLGRHARWPNVPCVVFPGNVGQGDSLSQAIALLQEACL